MSLLAKNDSWTFFRDDCSGCYAVNRCIRASAFSSGTRQYLLGLKGYKRPPSEAMMAGTQRHEERQVAIKTLDDYGIAGFFTLLESGRKLTVKEASVCSRFRAFRGHPDILTIQRTYRRPLTYRIHIRELKSGFATEYFFQLIAYCLVFSDPNVELTWRIPKPNGKGVKTVSNRLFPQKDLFLNIDASMEIFGARKTFDEAFMIENRMTEWGSTRSLAVQKRAKNLRRYRKHGLYWISAIPYCRYCHHDPTEHCPYWSNVCAPISYKPLRKSRQTFWGKKKMLIKTKPTIPKK